MRDIYLGDSYDIVKRFWADQLSSFGCLYAHSRFVPPNIRDQYTRMTTIPIAQAPPDSSFGLIFDPHTGVPYPHDGDQPTLSHAPIAFIAGIFRTWHPRYAIVFDQSYHRRHELSRSEQRRAKLDAFARDGIFACYYVSHAPFLFCATDHNVLSSIAEQLVNLGIPSERIERKVV